MELVDGSGHGRERIADREGSLKGNDSPNWPNLVNEIPENRGWFFLNSR